MPATVPASRGWRAPYPAAHDADTNRPRGRTDADAQQAPPNPNEDDFADTTNDHTTPSSHHAGNGAHRIGRAK